MIIVWGSVEAHAENLQDLLQEGLAHVHRSRNEPGCISHSVQIDAENENRLIFFEEWEDIATLLAHFAVSESVEFAEKARELAVCAPSLKIYESSQINNLV